MEKIKDERVLSFLNTLWKFYYDRNYVCLTAEEQKRIAYYMRQIKYPYLSTEKMTSEQLRAIILKNADVLGFELEKELAHSCQKEASMGNEKKILKNLEDLHAKVEQKIDNQPYWLWDQDEFKAAEARRNRIDVGHR
jgi:HPt (histidine-containing phosphotransfer) domain-containing protein